MKKRNGFKIMMSLIQVIKPLWLYMFFAVLFGSLGHLSAIFIPFGGILLVFKQDHRALILKLILLSGLLRGVFRYLEQALNHHLAFSVLAHLRDLVFGKVIKLSDASLERKDYGDLMALVTSDIEQLEVFFAHTISPVLIALIVNGSVLLILMNMSWMLGLISFISTLLVGVVIPIYFSIAGRSEGLDYRHRIAGLNASVLESVMGIFDLQQFGQINKRLDDMENEAKKLNASSQKMNKISIKNSHSVEGVIFTSNMLILMIGFYFKMDLALVLLTLTLHTSSFGPLIALSNLANNMNHTLASGDRLLDLLEEEVAVTQRVGFEPVSFEDVSFEDVSFSYEDKKILDNINLLIPKGKIIGIQGPSGIGKSTLIKLLMRIYPVESGSIELGNRDINSINTKELKSYQGIMSQESDLFQMSILDNIRLGSWDKSDEAVIEAAKKAGIHEFIEELDQGYLTSVLEFGSSLSSGERQRIALARLFLKDADLLLLDEPTSNLDALNEAIILKNLLLNQKNKTMLLTSHRLSTMNIADETFTLVDGKIKSNHSSL